MSREQKNINIEVGARIRQYRTAQKLTRDDLARLSGYSANFIQEVERGRSGLSSESMRAFATALGVSTDSILFGADNAEFSFVVEKLKTVPPEKLSHVIRIIDEAVKCAK